MRIIKYIQIIFLVSLIQNYGQTFGGLGIKFGYTSSNSNMYARELTFEDHDRRSHFNIGIFKDFKIMQNGFISSDLFYSGKGFKFSYDETNVKIDCLSLGLFYKYQFNLLSFIPYTAIGPRYDHYL